MTQEELARKAGISKRSIVKWETGPDVPTIRLARKLAAALETSPGYLIDGETQYPQPQPQGSRMGDSAEGLIQSTLTSLRSQAQSMMQQIDLLQGNLLSRASSKPISEGQRIAKQVSASARTAPEE